MMLIINMRTSVGEITVVRYIAQDQDHREGQKNFATFFSKLQLHPVISQIKFPLMALKSPICKNISDTKCLKISDKKSRFCNTQRVKLSFGDISVDFGTFQ